MALGLTCLLAIGLTAGCKDASMQQLDNRQKEMKNYKNRKILKPSNKPSQAPSSTTKRRPAPTSGSSLSTPNATKSAINNPVDRDLENSFRASRGAALMTGKPEEVAVRKISSAVQASLEVGPTLIVWVIDRTPSAGKLMTEGVAAARGLYDIPEIRQATTAAKDQNLLTAVVTFDDQVNFKVDPPVAEWQQARAGLDGIQGSEVGKEMPFTAIKQVLDKYLPLRTQDRREIVIVVLTDEAGDDRDLVDSVAEIVKKNAIPVYVLGSPAPWGQTNPFVVAGAKPPAAHDDTFPTHGPETLDPERVNIQMWGNQYGGREDFSMIDAGFGPFALARLAAVSQGEFFCLRPELGSVYQYRSTTIGHKFWPTGSELRFDPKVAPKYAPEYVSRQEYDQLVAANKARQSLIAAAKLAPVNIVAFPEQRFEKRNEAQMQRALNTAQQFAARHSPDVDKVYEVLSSGEGDRDKLPTKRLQAEYDLALGQTLAAKVRLDGYNSMLAALKRGKNFTNETSREWLLEQGTQIETGSQIQKMSEKAIQCLQRVVNDHPGTPWAKIAEQELKVPLGWTWREA
jgi:hypothetical protein